MLMRKWNWLIGVTTCSHVHNMFYLPQFSSGNGHHSRKKWKNILFLNLRSHGGAQKPNMSNDKRAFFFKRQLWLSMNPTLTNCLFSIDCKGDMSGQHCVKRCCKATFVWRMKSEDFKIQPKGTNLLLEPRFVSLNPDVKGKMSCWMSFRTPITSVEFFEAESHEILSKFLNKTQENCTKEIFFDSLTFLSWVARHSLSKDNVLTLANTKLIF